MATMKSMPTDEEVEDAGFADGGQMLLSMSPYERRTFVSQRPQTWDGELRQPIWRCMHHLISLIVRTIEDTVNVLWKVKDGGDLKLNRKEVATFKKMGGLAGAEMGSPGP